MATNPMQRKANNYLLIGIFSTLIFTGAIIALLFMQLNKLQTEKKQQDANMKIVSVLSADIKSGQTVSSSNLKDVAVPTTAIPSNALSIGSITEKTVAKINLKAGTVITADMVQESDNPITSDVRKQEFNSIILPSQIETGSYVDIRLRLSDGTDYIVVSKKQIEIPTINGIESANTFSMNMNEADIVVLNSAIIEAYIDKGSMLYATTYLEPGMQETAIPTYIPTNETTKLINSNPNISETARKELSSRYSSARDAMETSRNTLNSKYAQDKVDSIEAGVQQEITKAIQERQAYLESLGGY